MDVDAHPSDSAWKVFLADDDDDTRQLMGAALRRAGFEVVEAANGVELVEHVKREPAAQVIVISDVGMPELDGIAAARELCGERPGLPILLVTAFGDVDTVRRARAAGVKRVLAKPLDLGMLARTARELVRAAS
ncbi:MAG: response regulator [Polyangiaceae bacterium]